MEAHTSRTHPRDIFGKGGKATGKEEGEDASKLKELTKCNSDNKPISISKEDMKEIVDVEVNNIPRTQSDVLKEDDARTGPTGLMDKDTVLPPAKIYKDAVVFKDIQPSTSPGNMRLKKVFTFLPRNELVLIFCDGAQAINNVRKECGAKVTILGSKGDGMQEVIISGTEEAVEKAQMVFKNDGKILLSDYKYDELVKDRALIRRYIAQKSKTSIYINKKTANIFGSEKARKKAISMIKEL